MSNNSTPREATGIDSSEHTDDASFDFASIDESGDGGESDDDSDDTMLTQARDVVTDEFDESMWGVTEALLSAHATLLIDEVKNCTGVIIVGQSGAGKTTAIRFFEGLDEQVYRSDDATPASFVSHDASLTDEQLEDVDLLPRVSHRTLTSRDMATWFAGPQESIREKMALMAHLMDGEGYTRDSGSHGRRGYRGDYRFNFIGATTPLEPRAWQVMGHTGYRFVFYNLSSDEIDQSELENELFNDSRYPERVDRCREAVHSFLKSLWDEHGGYSGVEEHFDATDEAQEAIAYLAGVVKFSRATLREDDEPTRENPMRVGAVLRDIAQGRALLDGRKTIEVDDVQVSARITLSTMPRKRRPLIRALLDPKNGGKLATSQVQDALGVSRPTAIDRMEKAELLGIADRTGDDDDGRNPLYIEVKPEFEWPDCLDFPKNGGA